jgi:hypothetical protein
MSTNNDLDSLESYPRLESPARRPKINNLFISFRLMKMETKNKINFIQTPSKSPSKRKKVRFCPLHSRVPKKLNESHKIHIHSPEKYSFSSKKFPIIPDYKN